MEIYLFSLGSYYGIIFGNKDPSILSLDKRGNWFTDPSCEYNEGHNCIQVDLLTTLSPNSFTARDSKGTLRELEVIPSVPKGKKRHPSYFLIDGKRCIFGSWYGTTSSGTSYDSYSAYTYRSGHIPDDGVYTLWTYEPSYYDNRRNRWVLSVTKEQRVNPTAEVTVDHFTQYATKASITSLEPNIGDDRLDSLIFNRVDEFYRDLQSHPKHGNYSYVCADACESIRYPHHNVVMNTYEVLTLNKSVESMYNSYKDFVHAWDYGLDDLATYGRKSLTRKQIKALRKQNFKSAASSYLSYLYGPRLTAQELSEIALGEKSFEKHGYATAARPLKFSFNLMEFSGSYRTSFKYHFGVYNTAAQALNSYGLSPVSLVDVWDAVPYSFVVDWFVDVSDALDNPARRNFIDELPVSAIWYSEKASAEGAVYSTLPGSNALCTYTVKYYTRQEQQVLGSNLHGYAPSQPRIRGHIPEATSVMINLL